jgi:hypothetical protein
LANVVGTEEPIYGPSAIRSVAEDAKATPYTETTRDHLKWIALDQTSVETQVFYFMADSGHIGLAQIIYSNVAYGCTVSFLFTADTWLLKWHPNYGSVQLQGFLHGQIQAPPLVLESLDRL